MQQRYNAIIIGFGKGGKTLAAYLADQGQSVAIVERSDKMYGGTCINIACIPTKTLVYEAHKSLCRGERSFEEKAADYRRAIARKNEVTGFLRGKNYAMLADRDNVDVITGTASFVSPHEVEVKTADKTLLLSGERIFINTGGETVIPPIEGVRENPRVYTSTTMLELEDLPRRLVILGGGYIALEFASFYAEFGSRVTILERGSRFLAREDADVADSVRKALENKGVTIITGASASAVRDAGDEAEVRFILDGTEQALPADAILLATGRRPLTAGLNLEDNGTRRDCRGRTPANLRSAYLGSRRRQRRPAVHVHFAGRLPHRPGCPLRRGQARRQRPRSRVYRIHGSPSRSRGTHGTGRPRQKPRHQGCRPSCGSHPPRPVDG